jgi:hypothetical protein
MREEIGMRISRHLIVGAIIAACLSVASLTGCTQASRQGLRVRWVGTSGSSEMVYEYATFTGTEMGTVQVESEETLMLAYAATVAKGALTIRVQAPNDEILWETTLSESADEQQVELTPSEAGMCTILVIGDKTGGNFAVSWSAQ